MTECNYSVDTSLGTLIKLRKLIIATDLKKMLSGGEVTPEEVLLSLYDLVLGDGNKLNEFCRIVTGTNDDFVSMPSAVPFAVLERFRADFFAGIPESWKALMIRQAMTLMKYGKDLMEQRVLSGLMIPSEKDDPAQTGET